MPRKKNPKAVRGRPPHPLEHRYQVRCSIAERDAWHASAGALTLGEYTRLCVRVARGEATRDEKKLLATAAYAAIVRAVQP